jgi:hypothetical protein
MEHSCHSPTAVIPLLSGIRLLTIGLLGRVLLGRILLRVIWLALGRVGLLHGLVLLLVLLRGNLAGLHMAELSVAGARRIHDAGADKEGKVHYGEDPDKNITC